jgi:hypothetical protein
MSPTQRRRFTVVLAVDGLGTAAYCVRAARRPRDPAALADAAGALLGWTAAVLALRSGRAGTAAGWTVAGTTATLVGAAVGAVASRHSRRGPLPSVLLLGAGAALGGAYLRVLRADPSG